MATAQADPAAPARAPRSPVGIIFLTIFLDLVGFSIIFPLFPKMLQYYLPTAGQTGWMADTVHWLQNLSGGASQFSVEVLFAGLLGSLYSVLQFFFSPFWGRLVRPAGPAQSPARHGRRDGAELLALDFCRAILDADCRARAGRHHGGNVSVGTAAIADVTSKEKRSRGMTMVGIAFGLGFILGPALGGWLSIYDLTASYPNAAGLRPQPLFCLRTGVVRARGTELFLGAHALSRDPPGGKSRRTHAGGSKDSDRFRTRCRHFLLRPPGHPPRQFCESFLHHRLQRHGIHAHLSGCGTFPLFAPGHGENLCLHGSGDGRCARLAWAQIHPALGRAPLRRPWAGLRHGGLSHPGGGVAPALFLHRAGHLRGQCGPDLRLPARAGVAV